MNKSDIEYEFMIFTSENALTSLRHSPRSGRAVHAAQPSQACVQIPGERQSKGRVHLPRALRVQFIIAVTSWQLE